MDYLLRKADANDVAGINGLFIEMINTIYETDNAKGYDAGYLGRYFVNGEDWICVAEKDAEIVAFLSIQVHREEAFVYLDDLSVTKDHRGSGIGTALIGEAEAYAKEIGISIISLHVEKSNGNAYRLYKKLGFSEYKDEGSRVLMIKKVWTHKRNILQKQAEASE